MVYERSKKGRGRPAYVPTDDERAMVTKLAGYGLTQEEICQLIINDQTGEPLHRDTFRKHFLQEFNSGKTVAKMKVAKSAFQQAISGSVPAMTMFWLKTQCRWKETSEVEHTSPDGSMTPAPAIDASKLSTEALKEIANAAKPS